MDAFLAGFASNFAANLVSSVVVKVSTLLAKATNQAVKFDAADELKKLQMTLVHARKSFDSLRTTETWQCQTADVFGVLCDVEDLVDDLMVDTSNDSVVQMMRRSFERGSGSTKKKIQDVIKRLKKITSALEVGDTTQQQKQQSVNGTLQVPRNLVGREKEMEEIIKLLLDDTISSVIMFGMGGLGKTALAWHVQFDCRICEQFCFIWVPMPAEFDLKEIAESILHPGQESKYKLSLPDKIRGLFEEMYADKRALIVLDGLWDVTCHDWRSFSNLFRHSKVLVTTRNPQVASKIGQTPYQLPLMRDEECRDLVTDSALSFTRLDSRQQLFVEENIGAIAKKSKGLPLAAIILGLSLPFKCGDNDWINNDIYDTKEFKEEILPKLNLNTADINSDMMRCLAYCALYPRDHDFKRDGLVELWMAEGFILPQGKRSLREIGIEYIDDLYGRSFFQPSSELGEHETSSYKMHAFVHRFAELLALGICFRLEDINDLSSDLWSKQVRHLSLLCTSVQSYLAKIEECDGLRTFLLPSKQGMRVGQIPYSFFEKLGRLRVLDLSRTDVKDIPGSLGILKLLRYLNLSETPIQLLPESISNLVGLRILKLTGCTNLIQLPTDLYTLTSLVHLDVDVQGLLCMPAKVGSLIHLQTLPKFFVGDREGYFIRELQNLKQLRGKLKLARLENIRDEAEAREAKLCEKQSLRRLELEWSSTSTDGARAVDVFTGLEPHHYVEELKVTHYAGSSFPTWLTSQSCRLVSIEVKDCLLDDVLPALGQLPFLKKLHLQGMHRVMHMRNPVCRDVSGAFPLLESLKIENMMYLTHWHEFPDNCMLKLKELTVTNCPSLSSVQSLQFINSLQTLEITCCPVLEALPQLPPSVQSLIIIESDMVDPEWYRIRSIPSVEIDYNKVDFQ